MKRLFLILAVISAVMSINADTVITIYTPNGSTVEASLISGELDETVIQDYHDYVTHTYPQATILDEATQKYNSHAYVWHMTEGGDTCWINLVKSSGDNRINVLQYMTDGSYIQVDSDQAEKVFYKNINYSAIVSPNNPSKYISKWNEGVGPLVEHAPTYGPFSNTAREYYVHKNRYVEPEPEEPDFVSGELVPGSDIYPRGQAFEFSNSYYTDEFYTYEWSVDMDGDGDAVSAGKVTLRSGENPYSALVTFNSSGIFNVWLNVYTERGTLIGSFTSQAVVQ